MNPVSFGFSRPRIIRCFITDTNSLLLNSPSSVHKRQVSATTLFNRTTSSADSSNTIIIITNTARKILANYVCLKAAGWLIEFSHSHLSLSDHQLAGSSHTDDSKRTQYPNPGFCLSRHKFTRARDQSTVCWTAFSGTWLICIYQCCNAVITVSISLSNPHQCDSQIIVY